MVSLKEILALVTEAGRLKVAITITHPMTVGFGCTLTVEQQQELVAMGAIIEHSFVACHAGTRRNEPEAYDRLHQDLGG